MAGWNAVSGYLNHKPGGALARLKGRRRQWYVFDKSDCRLVSYKNESDANLERPPLAMIDLKSAAITLLSDEKNSFVIHSEGKEFVFAADNHESMMIWVVALQANRDTFRDSTTEEAQPMSAPELSRKCSLPTDRELRCPGRHLGNGKRRWLRSQSFRTGPERKLSMHYPQTRSIHASTRLPPIRHSSSVEEDDVGKEKQISYCPSDRAFRNSSSSSDGVPVTESVPASEPRGENGDGKADGSEQRTRNCDCNEADLLRRASQYSSTTGVTSDCDTDSDVGDLEKGYCPRSAIAEERMRYLRMINADASKECFRTQRASSTSGQSVSSDSAISHGESLLSLRLQDLEAELMATKCELAKALNRETSQKNELIEREEMLSELHEQIHLMESSSEERKYSPWKGTGFQKLNDRCRILQSHNRFLNEEVLKLSKMLQQQQTDATSYKSSLQDQCKEIDQLKRDYVFLMQSAIRIRSSEGPENFEVYLYGGDRHATRILQLLREARKTDSSLPTYDRQNKTLQHVDALGFQHNFTEESLALHYLCRKLHQHYRNLMPTSEIHLLHWNEYLVQHGDDLTNRKELKALVRNGIPDAFRSRVWRALFWCRIQDIVEDKGKHYYSNLCCMAPESEVVSQNKRQISLDLLRTLPNNIRFGDADADGIRKLQEVLQAFCLHNPTLGYCQGMNFLVGMCLLFLEAEDAFWCLVAITERYFASNYFDHSLVGAQADQEVLKNLLRETLPRLHHHLAHLDIELCTVTLNWFLAIFFDSVPFETLLRIWDCFLLEGPKVLFRFSLAILKMHEDVLLTKHDTVSIMRQLKAIAKLCFDADALIKVAFEGLEPFPRRQDIAAKQACYQKTLREQSRKRELEKQSLFGRDKLLETSETPGPDVLLLECAAVCDTDKIWVCHGNHNIACLSRINCEENIMYRLNIDLESRVTCMHSLNDDTVILGTLSHFVHSYSTRTRKLKWEAQLNDSVLSLCSYEGDDHHQVFAGLADGTMAVIENFSVHVVKPDSFYIQIGSSPVTCMRLVDKRIWCACGNRIVILSARTLDTIDQFQVSLSTLDYVSLIQPNRCSSGDFVQGVWLSIRGSSVIQLWDPHALTCKLLYDVRDDRYPKSPKDEEHELNQARITALLPLHGSVLVGTAEGFLIIYDVVKRIVASGSTYSAHAEQSSVQDDASKDDIDSTEDSDSRARKDSGYLTSNSGAISVIPPMITIDSIGYRSEGSVNDTSGSQRSAKTVIDTDAPGPQECAVCSEDSSTPVGSQASRDEVFSPEDGSVPSLYASWLSDIKRIYLESQPKPASDPSALAQRRWSLHTSLSSSMLEFQENRRKTALQRLCQRRFGYRNGPSAMSTDCIPAWIGRDTPSSSFTSDSYDFDDFFITYSDDVGVAHPQEDKDTQTCSFRADGNATADDVDVPASKSTRQSWSTALESNGHSSGCSFVTGNGDLETSTTQDANADEWLSTTCDNSRLSSDAGSSVSFGSFEPPYSYELVLQEKIKISDKAIRCLLDIKCSGETTVISGAGCYGDDEAILKWVKEGNEKLWTNDPVIEVCPYTNTIKPSPYTRSRMPRKSSIANGHATGFLRKNHSAVFAPTVHAQKAKPALQKSTSVVGSSLARVQSIFTKNP
ncbi:TBC1 domain family member 2A-like [Ornithodoros turicata]|uniref:TBC1 domain family member 2A-like n=1 Tax=Ornithodoros turicata TaxID=34597 RepID=UPI003138CB83